MARQANKLRHFIKNNIVSLCLFSLFLAVTLLFKLLGKDYIFLANVDFNSFFSLPSVILNILFITVLMVYFYGLGKYISNKFELNVTGSVAAGIGVVFFNIILLPLFLTNLIYYFGLIVLFLLLSLLLTNELNNLFKIRPIITKIRKFLILKSFDLYSTLTWLIIIFAFTFHFINAISPVNFSESFEDVANSYFDVFMNLAYFHGIKLIPNLAGTLTKFLNFEVITSSIIVLSNPEIVKLFGFSIFALLSIMLYDFCKCCFNGKWEKFALCVFLLCPVFLDDHLFSFAHDRVYFIFLSFLSFVLLFIGLEKKNIKYHYINFFIMGILVGVNQAGVVSATINFVVLFLFSNEWKKHLKIFSLFFIAFFCISSVFPVWNYVHSGSFMPTNTFINKMFNLNVDSDIFALYLSERVGLQFTNLGETYLLDYLLFPFRFIYEHFSILVFFFLLGFLLISKDRKLRIMYLYIMASMLIYLALFKNSVRLGGYARFHFVVLPFIITSITYVISKRSLRGYGKYFMPYLIIVIAVFMLIKGNLFLYPEFKIKKRFIAREIDLENYLKATASSINTVSKVKFLNANFTREDRILYFYHAQNIYTKAQLYQNTKPFVSILYTSSNQKIIMNKLSKLGISYLCIDNKWPISANNPFTAMVADITTPIFEPDYFAKHFIPLKTNIPDMYLFKINYSGIKDIDKIRDNRESVEKVGFYKLIYRAMKENVYDKNLIRIKLNPYSAETLLNKYGAFYSRKVTGS